MTSIVSKAGRLAALAAATFTVGLPLITHASDVLLKEVPITTEVASTLKNPSFTLTSGSKKWVVPTKDVKLWFKTRTTENGQAVLQLRPQAIYDYLNVNISPRLNKPGENSRFEYIGSNLHLIEGGTKGTIVDGIKTSLTIRAALAEGNSSAAVSMKEHRPTLFSAEDFKKLKFPELLTRGESNFAGSPSNRIHNINVATAKFNGLVILPGEEFSFNQYLDDVDEANGYKPELVIKENVTTPEFGGGICQVSTTAFRAAMQSGMKVTYRKSHSYPVKYYGAPGYDATVYQPFPDFRFVNDTKTPILLKTSIVGTKVYFDVWGTKNGREVTINGPFVTDKKPDGSLTAAIAQIVKQNGKVIREENFISKYQSPDKFPHVLKANGE